MKILAIESSCDETSAAVIENSRALANTISSQMFHERWGGVVPELASRAHLKLISQIVLRALEAAGTRFEDIQAVAVTTEPGLIGSLIVGSNFAKGLALQRNIPIVPVNHIEGHLYSGCLEDATLEFPFLSLVVSGGHTALFKVESFSSYDILGSTVDDAAGEAFDKIAKMLGLSYPGGPEIDRLAKEGNTSAYTFPRSMISDGSFNFSFSGLKTSVRYFLAREFPEGVPEGIIPDLAASVQEAIVDVLVKKSFDSAKKFKLKAVVAAGGVSANSRLRQKMTDRAEEMNIKLVLPETSYCMDNAAMIGFIAEKKLLQAAEDDYRDLRFTVNASALRAKRKKRRS